ncbi:hypothetical protein ABTN47_18600, partial [Acinetobacter baumannii]
PLRPASRNDQNRSERIHVFFFVNLKTYLAALREAFNRFVRAGRSPPGLKRKVQAFRQQEAEALSHHRQPAG